MTCGSRRADELRRDTPTLDVVVVNLSSSEREQRPLAVSGLEEALTGARLVAMTVGIRAW